VTALRLELGKVYIKDIQFGSDTKVENGVLYVNKEELLKEVGGDERLQSINFDIARPGEETRIIPVKDVIEPRVKVEGKGGIFPGFISKVDTVGSGRTHVLKGAAVVTTGKIVGFQEGIIDMSGEGARYTPFSKTNNLVIICEPKEGVHQHDPDRTHRLGLAAARHGAREVAAEIELEEEAQQDAELCPVDGFRASRRGGGGDGAHCMSARPKSSAR
jgi:glycine reductase